MRIGHDDEWLDELRQIYEEDRARREAREKSRAEREPRKTAGQFLKQCRAHELMRHVQKALLDGGGTLRFYEDVGGYDQAVILMWKGPISNAAKLADIEDVDTSIIVGANGEGVFVNDRKLSDASPEALRDTLLELARQFVTDGKP